MKGAYRAQSRLLLLASIFLVRITSLVFTQFIEGATLGARVPFMKGSAVVEMGWAKRKKPLIADPNWSDGRPYDGL
jgi:hypothetical protein